ncbi:MAG: 2-phosphosulfolactate phosphatase [Planctomycetota bacterium]
MTPILNVYALPRFAAPADLAGGTAVVIDVLRASTTIVHALEAGAKEVIPCLEVEDARAAAAELAPGEAVLGGERQGLPIDGFDLGNSPTEYTPDRVDGKTVVFTTTNGTQAMFECRPAARVLIGAFANASAVCRQLAGIEQIHLVCAGTQGEFSRDDVLLAGLLIERILTQGVVNYQLNVQALTARENWRSSFALPLVLGAEPLKAEVLAGELQKSPGGRNLTAVGLEADILTAAQIDRFDGVPELDTRTFRIRPAE